MLDLKDAHNEWRKKGERGREEKSRQKHGTKVDEGMEKLAQGKLERL